FLDHLDRPPCQTGDQGVDHDRVHQDDDRDTDQMPCRVSLLSCEIHVLMTPAVCRSSGRGYSMNCSLPTMPILVSPRRCADAITPATIAYFAPLSGRKCTSGCTAWVAAAWILASRVARSGIASPFQ